MSRWRFFYHIVWATKSRERLNGIHEEAVIRQSLDDVSQELDIIPHAIGVMPDHVHVAVSIPPRLRVSDVVQRLKGRSSHAVNHARAMAVPRFGWQPEYSANTFGEYALPRVSAYICSQREHHD